MWRANVLTIFPEVFPGPLGASLAGKALSAGLWPLDIVDIRNFATDKHRSVDDTPAGGGPGMVMKARPTWPCHRCGRHPRPPASPALAARRAADPATRRDAGRRPRRHPRLRPVRGGRRARDRRPRLEEVSVGDYVLSGGEIAAMVLIDACVRLLPGVMGTAGLGRRGKLRGRPVGISPLHPAPALGGARHPGNPAVGRPRQDRGLAAAGGGTVTGTNAARIGGGAGPPPGATGNNDVTTR